MRGIIGLGAAALVVVSAATAFAGDRDDTRRHRVRRGARHVASERSRDDNQPCMRDTGKPMSELSFRNRCDTLEFWARMQERAIGPR